MSSPFDSSGCLSHLISRGIGWDRYRSSSLLRSGRLRSGCLAPPYAGFAGCLPCPTASCRLPFRKATQSAERQSGRALVGQALRHQPEAEGCGCLESQCALLRPDGSKPDLIILIWMPAERHSAIARCASGVGGAGAGVATTGAGASRPKSHAFGLGVEGRSVGSPAWSIRESIEVLYRAGLGVSDIPVSVSHGRHGDERERPRD